jgi:CheY-like chemotaxis protein
MPDGGTIAVVAENRTLTRDDPMPLADGDYVVITVVDSGCGMSADLLDKVLEPFFTTKDVGKGTGLGLSMVYGFARQSNGAFNLDSKLGHGTTAELWLPRAPAEAKADTLIPDEEVRGDEGERQQNLRILLVDDHKEVRGTTAATLEDFGHTVVECSSGADAIEMLEDGDCDYDLLISDYAMPHLSGTEFLRGARKLCPDVPSLIITGYAEEDAICDRPEGVEILLKPFTAAKLEAAVARVCKEPRQSF